MISTSLAWSCEFFFAHHFSPSLSYPPHHCPFTPVEPGYVVDLFGDDYHPVGMKENKSINHLAAPHHRKAQRPSTVKPQNQQDSDANDHNDDHTIPSAPVAVHPTNLNRTKIFTSMSWRRDIFQSDSGPRQYLLTSH
jgi:hypothetical protein